MTFFFESALLNKDMAVSYPDIIYVGKSVLHRICKVLQQ